MRDLREWRPGFCTEFRYESRGHSGLVLGAIFEKVTKYKEMHILPKKACPKTQEMLISDETNKNTPEAQRQRQPGAFQKIPCLKTSTK